MNQVMCCSKWKDLGTKLGQKASISPCESFSAQEWLEHARRETEEVAEKLRKKYEKARHQGTHQRFCFVIKSPPLFGREHLKVYPYTIRPQISVFQAWKTWPTLGPQFIRDSDCLIWSPRTYSLGGLNDGWFCPHDPIGQACFSATNAVTSFILKVN